MSSINFFSPAQIELEQEAVVRPSLSYWRDAWQRLKKNRRAMWSLWSVVFLILFTLLGPVLYPVNPAHQDLSQISYGPALSNPVLIVADEAWEAPSDDLLPATSEVLTAPAGLAVAGDANTEFIRLVWEPVAGADRYEVYRHLLEPSGPLDLGLPVRETRRGELGFEDRMKLEPTRYYYSVRAIDPQENRGPVTTLVVEAIPAMQLADAQLKAWGEGVQAGDRVERQSHLMGTDALGRDMLARLLHGGRTSLFIGIVAPVIFLIVGIFYGGISGYLGGRVDEVMMRFADFVIALPFLLFMILFRVGFGIGPGESGIFPMLIALVLLGWPSTARLVRGQVLQIREHAFVEAARLCGAPSFYLIVRHMLPNVIGVILVALTFSIPSAIFTEAFLSFIGLGVAPPATSWGAMCNDGVKTMLSYPHELLFPALFISWTVLAFNLLGDGLRDALDVKMRNQ